jgi:hypothetical protein
MDRNPWPAWATWLLGTGVVVVGVTAGAGIAHAFLGKRSPRGRSYDPSLEPAVDQAIADHGAAQLNLTTNAAYHSAFPHCPRTLDPSDQSHADCVRAWLRVRDMVLGRLPPPVVPTPEEEPGLATTGPAADIRGWLQSLTPAQRSGLRDIVGAELVDPVERAAIRGDDQATVNSVVHMKKTIEDYAEEHPFDALRQYQELKKLLGPKLDVLLQLAEQHRGAA